MSDLLFNFGMIIAATLIYCLKKGEFESWSKWDLIDPGFSLFFAFIIIYLTYPVIKESIIVLLEGVPSSFLII